jgi:negative regulator of genetic competence, sporulation and motility
MLKVVYYTDMSNWPGTLNIVVRNSVIKLERYQESVSVFDSETELYSVHNCYYLVRQKVEFPQKYHVRTQDYQKPLQD